MTNSIRSSHLWFLLVALAGLTGCIVHSPAPVAATALDPRTTMRIGQRIWQNECGGTVAGLTSWNSGENFASLGIGHFIWYPEGQSGPFYESFPPMIAYLQSRGVALPPWLLQTRHCPWHTRAEFQRDSQGQMQQDLRTLLAATVPQQTEYIIARLHHALPDLSMAGGPRVRANYAALSGSAGGMYAMLDYINFKGDGVNKQERYNNEGWGLAQVLGGMRAPTLEAFAESAKRVLTRRVQNAPPQRGEQRWLRGWLSRCDGYKRGI